MKKALLISFSFLVPFACNNKDKEKAGATDDPVLLRTDIVNVVKMSDTLIAVESACRGCAYEETTHFSISDSLGLVSLQDVVTIDNNSPDVDGGSLQKDLVIIPLKTGITQIKVYKFRDTVATADDSASFKTYTLDIRN